MLYRRIQMVKQSQLPITAPQQLGMGTGRDLGETDPDPDNYFRDGTWLPFLRSDTVPSRSRWVSGRFRTVWDHPVSQSCKKKNPTITFFSTELQFLHASSHINHKCSKLTQIESVFLHSNRANPKFQSLPFIFLIQSLDQRCREPTTKSLSFTSSALLLQHNKWVPWDCWFRNRAQATGLGSNLPKLNYTDQRSYLVVWKIWLGLSREGEEGQR